MENKGITVLDVAPQIPLKVALSQCFVNSRSGKCWTTSCKQSSLFHITLQALTLNHSHPTRHSGVQRWSTKFGTRQGVHLPNGVRGRIQVHIKTYGTTHYTQAAIAGTWACVQKGLHKYVMYNKDDDPSMQSLWATPTKRNARVETLQCGKAAQTYNMTNRHHQLPPCYGYRALFLDLTTCTEFGSWNKAKLGHCVRNMRLGLRFHRQPVMQTKRSENTRVLFLRLDELVSKV